MKYQQPYGITDPSGNAPYINGDPSIGRAGSIPPAAAFEYPMRELVNLTLKCGLTPTDADLFQLLKSIRTQVPNYVVDFGTPNNVAGAFDPPLDAYNNGFVARTKIAHTNTEVVQANFGPGWAPVVHLDTSPLSPGDMVVGMIAELAFLDGNFQLLNPFARAVQLITGGTGPAVTGGGNTYITNNFGTFSGMVAWENPGTYDWTVPGGVRKIWLREWAGGGPGVEWVQDGSFIKGGDGGYVEGVFDVVPGDLMRIVVGAGAPPPVPQSNGNITYNATNWKNTFGQSSSFGKAGSPVICSATGGRGCYPNPPGDTDPSPGEPGHGTGGAVNRANGIYGKGGGWNRSSDGVQDDYLEDTGEHGACIIAY